MDAVIASRKSWVVIGENCNDQKLLGIFGFIFRASRICLISRLQSYSISTIYVSPAITRLINVG